MKASILTFRSIQELEHMKVCLANLNLSYRLQTTLTGIHDIEVYHQTAEEITELKKQYHDNLQHKIF